MLNFLFHMYLESQLFRDDNYLVLFHIWYELNWPPKRHVEVLTPITLECDLILETGSSYIVKMRSYWSMVSLYKENRHRDRQIHGWGRQEHGKNVLCWQKQRLKCCSCQGSPAHHQKLGQSQEGFTLQFSEGTWPADTFGL